MTHLGSTNIVLYYQNFRCQGYIEVLITFVDDVVHVGDFSF